MNAGTPNHAQLAVAQLGQAQLVQQQNGLLAAIFTVQADLPSRGLAAYRTNAHASAQRALQAAYPVIEQLVGPDNFALLARDFGHQHPPQRGDLAHWGHQLAAFLATSSQLVDTPYLADVAHIEWALHTCAGAADRAQDSASFAALAQHAPENLSFTIAPGVHVLASAYPAAAIVLAHQGQGTLGDAAALLGAGAAQTALVWRAGFAPRVRALAQSEQAFTQAVCSGLCLAHALDCADTAFDFSAWLTAAVQSGLVMGVVVASSAA